MLKARPSARHGCTLKLHREEVSGEVSITQLQPQSPEKLPIDRDGTALAISNSTLGVAAHSPHRTDRGGARNRADRESRELSAAHVGNLIDAARHADAIGLPLNRMITIHWEAAGLLLEDMAKATGRFTGLMAKALQRHGSQTAWLWVHEGGEREGGHCHMLAHVPADLVPVVRKLQKGWLGRITDSPYRKDVICSKPIGGRLGIEASNPDLYAANLNTVLEYVLKGASQEATSHYGLTRLKAGGCVIGKRCGTSQNIGAKARSIARP
ncbi:MAG: hypothetical protein EPO45_00395 [Sphingobium sp.]|nr:hypothetical protein [Alphaproteobacteria bacterium]MBU0866921.1 hypothetical protein [Alphaproteobacteria bacterium]MBU1795377.1 hypothetical protein [Alphaproteobacteria bacterium]TAJ81062.1 MAG: hypothetical protein EPO45_00395 [Sphingobium sp.]